MNCDICLESMEGGKTTEFPCCDRVTHSQCAINNMSQMAHYSSVAKCLCGHVFYQSPYFVPHTDEVSTADRVAAVRVSAREEIKKIRSKLLERNKNKRLYMSHIRSKAIEYSAAILGHVTAIKALKEEALAGMKATPVARAFRSGDLSYMRMKSIFKKKHNLQWEHMRSIFGYETRRWISDPESLITRKFRVRI